MSQNKDALSEKQIRELERLTNKEKKLTPKQEEVFLNYTARLHHTSSDPLSESCKTYLFNYYAKKKYGKRVEMPAAPINYLMKGMFVERRVIDMLERRDGVKYYKNKARFKNGFILGIPDILTPDIVMDVKAAWDLPVFWQIFRSKLKISYWWQMQGYLELTGKEYGDVVYGLASTPWPLIEASKKKLKDQMSLLNENHRVYRNACKQLEESMRFTDIPEKERLVRWRVYRNEAAIQKIYVKVEKCRNFLIKIEEDHRKSTNEIHEIRP